MILQTRPDFEGVGPFVSGHTNEWKRPEVQKSHNDALKKHHYDYQLKIARVDTGGAITKSGEQKSMSISLLDRGMK